MKNAALIILIIGLLPLKSLAQGCTDADPDQRLKVFGFLQPQYSWKLAGDNDLLTSSDGVEVGDNSFAFNRARVGVTGNIPYDFMYYANIEFSPTFTGNPFLLDAFVGWTRFKWFKASVGQFKVPFTLELQTPCHKLNTIYRTNTVVNLVGPIRDFGLMFYGGNDTTLFFYQVGAFNGTGIPTPESAAFYMDDNKGKDIIGRVLFQPFGSSRILAIGGSGRMGSSAPAEEGVDDDTYSSLGAEVNFRLKGFTVQGEYIWREDKGSYTTGGGCGGPGEVVSGSITRFGAYGTLMYMTPWRFQPVYRIEYFDQDMNETEGSFVDQKIQVLNTVGFNYFFNDWTRLQVNYCFGQGYNNDKANNLLVQIQASF
jgi:hypothetical protein